MELSFDRMLEIFGPLGIVIGLGVAIAMAPKVKGEMLFAIGCFVSSGLILCLTVGAWGFRTNVSPALRVFVIGIVCACACIAVVEASRWAERRYRSEQKPIISLDQRNRVQMLKRVRLDWIDGVLKQSLYSAARIELRLETNPNAIQPLRAVIQSLDRPSAVVSANTPMSKVFDEQGGALLILGAPGAGKTTFLLELAKDLLDRAEQDINQPMPVVFNLSSWAVRRFSLDRWLISELKERSDVPTAVAQQWVETEQIIPLLDGLDEVAPEQRQACASAINDFRSLHGLLPIAVCSRIADYEALSAKLRLRNAVVVQSLTKSDVRGYLDRIGEQARTLEVALKKDISLWELLDTPLMLWVAMLAYRDVPVKFFTFDTLKQRRKRLFSAFVDAMFKRRSAETRYTSKQTISWLSWLASTLERNGETVFYLENLSEGWLATGSQRVLSRIAVVLGTMLICALFGGLVGAGLHSWLMRDWLRSDLRSEFFSIIGGMVLGSIIGAGPGLVGGVIAIFIDLQPVETIKINLVRVSSRLRKAIRDGLGTALMGALFFGALGALNQWLNRATLVIPLFRTTAGSQEVTVHADLKVGISAGLLFGLAIGLATLLSGQAVESRSNPNQGTTRSVGMALAMALGFGLTSGVIYGLRFGLGSAIFNGLMLGLISGLVMGGLFSLRHFVLRLMLGINRSAPLRYPRFLDHAVERVFLRRVGGGYMFIHRMLSEYFTSLAETSGSLGKKPRNRQPS